MKKMCSTLDTTILNKKNMLINLIFYNYERNVLIIINIIIINISVKFIKHYTKHNYNNLKC